MKLAVLQVVSLEAIVAGRKPVAEQALKLLWDETIAAEGGASACRPGDGAVIGRNLIKLVAGDPFACFCRGLACSHLSATALSAVFDGGR